MFGGGGEIRTHGRLAPSLVFKTSALNRSATPPERGFYHFALQMASFVVLIIDNERITLIYSPRESKTELQNRFTI
jgi:hypothetical protein